MKSAFSIVLCLLITAASLAQNSLSFNLTVDKSIRASHSEQGRLFVFLSTQDRREPRTQTWPDPVTPTYIFAKNIKDFPKDKTLKLAADGSWIGTADWNLNDVPDGEYHIQIVWDQDTDESRIDAAGNLYSESQAIKINQSQQLEFVLSQQIQPRKIVEHPLVREVDMQSKLLSKWWGKEVRLKASVLLPLNYDKNKVYPIRYNIAGYGGRYDRINFYVGSEQFMGWWESGEAPEVITVYLDGEGPFGDCYQMDSENSGPYGKALTEELIPYIEGEYRGTVSPTHRFVDGCSTGGWVSLGLQLYYPDIFDGVFSYSPDAIAFENYNLMNIYEDENVYVNEFGYERPIMRDLTGEPMLSLRDFIQYENVLGASNTYLNSGGQFSAHSALYSQKGENGLPKPLFDPQTGVIDRSVSEHWKKYDFKLYAKENWAELGPKIQGKIYIWMGDMDDFYLNLGTREFETFIRSTTNPTSDAVIEFSAMEGHCWQFSDVDIMTRIQEIVQKSN